ncbi:MAG: cation:proton antiporter [Bacteroidota bacterium]|nr:cation:proton antiporter [Bacteroidota bacterium]
MANITSYFPITDPTQIFFVVMLIILFAPIVMGKLRIPHIIGMILAGILVGPHGLGLLAQDSSFHIFGTVGLYFIMLLAGLEMNMEDFKHNRDKTVVHGLLAFAIPMILGFAVNSVILKYGVLTSILLASMYASHTLIAYPTVMKFGLTQERSVTIAVGATAITDTLTLLVLAIIVALFKGNVTGWFWVMLVVKTALVFTIIILGFPRMARKFFKLYDSAVVQFIFVIVLMFLAAILMELVDLEGLLGAFLTGLVLNRYVPKVSRLMYNLEFVGNAIFIPYFLISVGMLVSVESMLSGWTTIKVASVMILIALTSKWLASLMTQKTFRLQPLEREMIFGLSNAQAGATLAAVMVGYNIFLPDGQRLLNNDVLNGTIILILVTCLYSSVTTERASKLMVLRNRDMMPHDDVADDEKILIPMNYPEIADSLMSLGIMMRNNKLNRGLVGLNVIFEDHDTRNNLERGRKLLDHMLQYANSMNVLMQTQVRISNNIATSIKHAFNEFHASEIIMGLHTHHDVSNKFWGDFHQNLFNSLSRQIIMAHIKQPLNTIRRIQVAVPSRAQYEPGFYRWIERLARVGDNIECRMIFHGRKDTLILIGEYMRNNHPNLRGEYLPMEHWNELPQLATTIANDHLFVVVSARKGTISYKNALERLPDELRRHFSGINLMIIFPDQYDGDTDVITVANPQIPLSDSPYEDIREWIKGIPRPLQPEGE